MSERGTVKKHLKVDPVENKIVHDSMEKKLDTVTSLLRRNGMSFLCNGHIYYMNEKGTVNASKSRSG